MSRIGKLPVTIPESVTVSLENHKVSVSGPKGELHLEVKPEAIVAVENGKVIVTRKNEEKNVRAYHGLIRSLIANMVKGVTDGWQKTLEMSGVGYRAEVSGDKLILNVGFSHPVQFLAPVGITFEVKEGKITVSGFDKGLVGETAARIRRIRPPEPYKGKGIHYLGEKIRRKAGKAGKVGVGAVGGGAAK